MSSKMDEMMDRLRSRWLAERFPDGGPPDLAFNELTREFLQWVWDHQATDSECADFIHESVIQYHVERAEAALSEPDSGWCSTMVPAPGGKVKQVWAKRKKGE